MVAVLPTLCTAHHPFRSGQETVRNSGRVTRHCFDYRFVRRRYFYEQATSLKHILRCSLGTEVLFVRLFVINIVYILHLFILFYGSNCLSDTVQIFNWCVVFVTNLKFLFRGVECVRACALMRF